MDANLTMAVSTAMHSAIPPLRSISNHWASLSFLIRWMGTTTWRSISGHNFFVMVTGEEKMCKFFILQVFQREDVQVFLNEQMCKFFAAMSLVT